jgi:hypothetical protein
MGENTLPVVPPKPQPPENLITAGKPGPAPTPIPIPQPCVTFFRDVNFTGPSGTAVGEIHRAEPRWSWGTGPKKNGDAYKEMTSLIVCPRTQVNGYWENGSIGGIWQNPSFTDNMRIPDVRGFNDKMAKYDVISLGTLRPQCDVPSVQAVSVSDRRGKFANLVGNRKR